MFFGIGGAGGLEMKSFAQCRPKSLLILSRQIKTGAFQTIPSPFNCFQNLASSNFSGGRARTVGCVSDH